jgi:hypothetical protein
MFARQDLFQFYVNRRGKHGKLNLDAEQFERRNFLKSRIFKRGAFRAMRDNLDQALFRRKLSHAAAQPSAEMQCYERAAGLLQNFVAREVFHGFSVSNSQYEGAPRECQEQLLFAITE